MNGGSHQNSGLSSNPVQRRPRGALSVVGILGEALMLLDAHSQLHAIFLSDPYIKVMADYRATHCAN